jgi:phospholipase/carboxylesterase
MHNDYPEIKALNNKPTKLMVFLHGVGSDGNDLISLVPYIQKSLAEYHFVSPHGVESYDMAPFGRQWFSLRDRASNTIIKLAKDNAPKVQEQIKLKQKELNIDNENTVIFGFSQGTMMGIYLTLTQEKPFKAMIGFSGRLISPTPLKNTKTPICIVHGAEDDVVDSSEGHNLAEYCKQNSIEHKLLIIPNLTHSIDGEGMEFALNFLKNLK